MVPTVAPPDDATRTSPDLLAALARLRDRNTEYDGYLANHAPMVAEALTHLGGESSIESWVGWYARRLEPIVRPDRPVDDDNWREHLGDARLMGAWIDYLRRQAETCTWRALLRRWWPRLVPGIAASATHGVIHTAHAVRSLRSAGERPDPLLIDELALGLALWAARHQTLPGMPSLDGPYTAAVAADELPRLDVAVAPEGPGIAGRLRALQHLDGIGAALDGWHAPDCADDALDRIIALTSRVLAGSDGAPVAQVALCHAVTAPAAVRLVLPELSEDLQIDSVRASWHVVGSIIAAYAGPEPIDVVAPADGVDVAALNRKAIEHGDEHVIKLTEVAAREFARSGDAAVLTAADRFRSRIPPVRVT